MPDLKPFERPQFRQVLGVFIGTSVLLNIGLAVALNLSDTLGWSPINLTDPLLLLVLNQFVFGSCSLWVVWQYRRHNINLRSLFGPWPAPSSWRALLGLWITLFIFSLGSFQVLYTLLSFWLPEWVNATLQESIFLGTGDTSIPWLYNTLIIVVLVIGAPILEEFLFRGFLIHRWGTRWNPRIAVILSSILFGVLHPNPIGLSVFGLALALLYLRSRSLGLAIVVHSLNNAIAAGLEILTRIFGWTETPSLANFRADVWLGVMFLLVSTPFLVRFVRQNWRITRTALPYFVRQEGIP
ncbi:MAG: CPBP family intramembrane glutamic endopeptidase [Cyanobacteria bacterium P01_F01_bin.86]